MQVITPNQTLKAKGPHYCIANPAEYDGPRYGGEHYRIASDALDSVHFNPEDDVCDNGADCSPENPCYVAATYLLVTGRIAGARGYIPGRQLRPTNYIAPEATGQGAPVGADGTIHTTPENTPTNPGKGTGSGGGRRKSGPKPPTDKQLNLIKSLKQQLNDLLPKPVEESPEELENLTSKEASGRIDSLLSAIKIMRREASKAQSQKEEKEEEVLVEGGMYRHGEDIYWIVRAKGSQRLYAKRVVIDGEDAALEYAGGMVRRLDPSQQLTSEEALEIASLYGKTTGKCMVCDRSLSNADSIAEGIGPICKTKF